MTQTVLFKRALKRFALVFAAAMVFVFLLGELAHAQIKESFDRPPETVELTLPAGTAAKVARGEEIPSIPAEMSFVVGDTLVVYNEDYTAHELGPLYIPANSSATLTMDAANSFEYSCSFRPTQFLGLTVQEATTLNIRLIALGYVSPATAIFFFLYSLAIWPLNPKEDEA